MNKKLLVITVGMSCSGKTTWAEQFVKENPDFVNLNRDEIRFQMFCDGERDWTKYKFNKKNENEVTEVIEKLADYAANHEGHNIIISDTNLNSKIRQKWYDWADVYGYDVVTKEFPISWEEAVKRNDQRLGGISRTVLRSQYERMNDYLGRKMYDPDESKPKAMIIDVDGTVADMTGIRKPYEWGKVHLDKPRSLIIDIIWGLMDNQVQPVFLSGRDGSCSKSTYDWIDENIMHWYEDFPLTGFPLFMREAGDNRKDTVVKEELFWKYVANNYNVVAAFDDRPCVVNLWNEIGIPNVIAVADQTKEF